MNIFAQASTVALPEAFLGRINGTILTRDSFDHSFGLLLVLLLKLQLKRLECTFISVTLSLVLFYSLLTHTIGPQIRRLSVYV